MFKCFPLRTCTMNSPTAWSSAASCCQDSTQPCEAPIPHILCTLSARNHAEMYFLCPTCCDTLRNAATVLQGTPGPGASKGCVVPRQRDACRRLQESSGRRRGTRAASGEHPQPFGAQDIHPLAVQGRLVTTGGAIIPLHCCYFYNSASWHKCPHRSRSSF
jgi:hypothetical protein